MDQVRFESPVRVVVRPGDSIAEICSAEQAFDFLSNCPLHDGPIYECALEACFVAMIDPGCIADARLGLSTFAKVHGLLAN